MPAPRIASVRTSSRASSRRRDAGDGGGANRGDRPGVQQRARLAGLAVEERDEALVRVEAASAVAGEDRDGLEPPELRVAAAVGRHQPHQARLARAGGRRSEAGCAPRRARATRAPRPSRRCTRPSAAAAARPARRGCGPSCEERAYALAVGGRERKLARREDRVEVLGAVRPADRAVHATASTHANASAAIETPRASASARSRSSPSKTRVVDEVLVRLGPHASSASPPGTARRAGTCRSASRRRAGRTGRRRSRARAQSGSTASSSSRSSSEYEFWTSAGRPCPERLARVPAAS